MSSLKSDKFFNTCQGQETRKTDFSFSRIATHSPPGLWPNSAQGWACDSWVTQPANQEPHWVGVQALLSGDQNGASHCFKSVPLSSFADRPQYHVLWSLLLHLRDKERGRAPALTRQESPSAPHYTSPFDQPQPGVSVTLAQEQKWETTLKFSASLHPSPPSPSPPSWKAPAPGVVPFLVKGPPPLSSPRSNLEIHSILRPLLG